MTTREVPAGEAFGPLGVDLATAAGSLIARGYRRRWRRPGRYRGRLPGPLADPGAEVALSHQASRALLIGALAYRIVATLVPVTVLISRYGPARLGLLAGTAALLVAGSAGALVLVCRRPEVDLAGTRGLVLADLGLGFLVNVLASWLAPAAISDPYRDVFWFYLVACVVLVTGAWGVGAGLATITAAVPLLLVMDRLVSRYPVDLSAMLGRLLWLAIGLVMAVVILALVGLGAGEAMRQGERSGQAAERARILRSMHDTVLQALEAMALDSSADAAAPAAARAEQRRAPRAGAATLRSALDDLVGAAQLGPRGGRLRDALAAVVSGAAAHGVHADLVVADLDDAMITAIRVEALRDAVREALRNIGKHAGVTRAVVRVAPADGGVQVVVRDHGRGFAVPVPGPVPGAGFGAGFGVAESIVGRLASVGGTGQVESWPGRGTRVRLWVPA